jgi:hypothetical protein
MIEMSAQSCRSDEAQRLVNDLIESAEAVNKLVEGFMGFD